MTDFNEIKFPVFVIEDLDLNLAFDIQQLIAGVEVYDIDAYRILDSEAKEITMKVSATDPRIVAISSIQASTDSNIHYLYNALQEFIINTEVCSLDSKSNLNLHDLVALIVESNKCPII